MPDATRTMTNLRTAQLGGLAVALAVSIGMVATEPRLAIVWDEGYTLGREARLRTWFWALIDPAWSAQAWTPPPPGTELVQFRPGDPPAPTEAEVGSRAKVLFDPAVVDWFWPFAREEPHGHPAFYALIGLAGDILTPWRDALPRARLVPMLLFGIAAGSVFAFATRRYGLRPGLVAAGAWALQPQLFGHGHYATYDAVLTSLWVLAILAFAVAVGPEPPRARPTPRPKLAWDWMIAFGVLAGFAADTKLTGWFLPLPFLAWAILYRDRRAAWTLGVGMVVAAVVVYGLNPPWWGAPIAGVGRFLRSNLTRGETIPIPVLFLGKVYNTPVESLPWYNTLAWTAFVTPVAFLLLAVLGALRAVWRWRAEPFGMLALGHWAFLLILRALPHTPGHDGVRQFLPAFGVLAIMAGLGMAGVVELLGRRMAGLAGAVVAVALAEGAASVALSMPVPLSYFSPAIGGLPGAARLGMEPTYYWDGLTDEVLDWLRDHTPRHRSTAFATNPTSWLYLSEIDRLRPFLGPRQPRADTVAWYVVQNRPGAFRPVDRALIRSGRPAYVASKWGVPLVWIYPYSDLEAVLRGVAGVGPVTP